ncbi:hypothetical protein ACEPAF_8519 [Sanghuangporus sanghuang]
MCEPQTSAPHPLHNKHKDLNIFSDSFPATSTDPVRVPAAPRGGMLQTPYINSDHSVSSSEDSPSPRTPPIFDAASSVSPHPTPSPNIQSLSLGPKESEGESDSDLCAPEQEAFPPESKSEDNNTIRHPLVVLAMDQQQNIPQPNQQNTGKGGCWTCRIRRKKCDEQRTDNSCQTCIRLRIDCLGWGPKRPAWMRDKQAVEAYKAGIKEKLIKAGMVRGQPRLTQSNASRASTLPSGTSTPSGSSAYGQPHPAHRSMSGPAAFGGLGGMGSINPMGAFGTMGGPMLDSSMPFEVNQQQYAQHQQHHAQSQSVRYGPYPSPRALQGFPSPHLSAQQVSNIPQASAVTGAGEFDYLGIPSQFEHDQHQQQHINRRLSFGVSPQHQRNTQQLERRRHSQVYTSSPSLAVVLIDRIASHRTASHSIRARLASRLSLSIPLLLSQSVVYSPTAAAPSAPVGPFVAGLVQGSSSSILLPVTFYLVLSPSLPFPAPQLRAFATLNASSRPLALLGLDLAEHVDARVFSRNIEARLFVRDGSGRVRKCPSDAPHPSTAIEDVFFAEFHLQCLVAEVILSSAALSPLFPQRSHLTSVITCDSSPSHGNSPYFTGLAGPFVGSTSMQGPSSSATDYSNDVFGTFRSGSDVTNISPAMRGLAVPGMNTITGVAGVSGSPSMISGDESLLFAGGGTYAAPSSRSPSASASASASEPSRSNSTPAAGYSDPLTDPALVDPHVQYYFDSVMPMQYSFASGRARGVLQNLFAREPYGALVNASCALAAKHNKTIRVARLLDPPDADPQQSTAQQFFNRACLQLANTTTHASDIGAAASSAGYSASDALASLHLVAYFSLQGGTGDWQIHLNMARNWLSQTALCAPENEAPKEALALMGEAEQLAAKMIIWYDVFAAISQQHSPRFLETCRRLFGSLISREASGQTAEITNMSHFMGCPEDVLLILAETAALAQWKAQERQIGTLSNRELLRRGVAIENRLLVSSIAEGAAPTASAETAQMHPTRPPGEHSGSSPAMSGSQVGQGGTVSPVSDAIGASRSSVASASTSSFDPLIAGERGTSGLGASGPRVFGTVHDGNLPDRKYPSDIYQRVGKVFLHTATLYLASVINDPSPSNPEISNAVTAIVSDLANLTDVPVDRMFALPLALAGCMTDLLEQRQFIRSRLCSMDEAIGNVRSVRILMERVWAVRDSQGGVVDWYDIMRHDFGVEILLV